MRCFPYYSNILLLKYILPGYKWPFRPFANEINRTYAYKISVTIPFQYSNRLYMRSLFFLFTFFLSPDKVLPFTVFVSFSPYHALFLVLPFYALDYSYLYSFVIICWYCQTQSEISVVYHALPVVSNFHYCVNQQAMNTYNTTCRHLKCKKRRERTMNSS